MSEVDFISEDGSYAVGQIHDEVFAFRNNQSKLGGVKQSVSLIDTAFDPHFYARWGYDNCWPQQVVEICAKSNLLNTCIEYKAKSLYGNGLVYGHLSYDQETGEEKLTPLRIKEIDAWLKRTNINRFLYESAWDRAKYANSFPQLLMGRGTGVTKPYIAGLYSHDANEVRLGKQDLNSGAIKEAFISADWGRGIVTKESAQHIACLDPYYDVIKQIKDTLQPNYILPSRNLLDGQKYYAVPNWWGIVESKWIDNAEVIPKYKRAIIDKQIYPKWHVEIDENYWPEKYKDWEKKSEKEQQALYKKEYREFLDRLGNKTDSGRVIMSPKVMDEVLGEKVSQWVITPINTKSESGEHIEDSQEVDFNTIRIFGINPILIGVNQKNGLGAGSGSDQRIAYINYILSLKAEMDSWLEWSHVVAEINGWNEKYSDKDGNGLVFWTKRYFAATLDLGDKPKSKEDAN